MSSRTCLLPTPTMIAMTLPIKKILLWTCQMATKTEDSLVFSWEGRHIPFSFRFLFWTFLLDIYFHFRDWFSKFHFRLGRLLICSQFTCQVRRCFKFTLWRLWATSLYLQKCFQGATFLLRAIPSQMPWSRGFWLWWIALSLSSFFWFYVSPQCTVPFLFHFVFFYFISSPFTIILSCSFLSLLRLSDLHEF